MVTPENLSGETGAQREPKFDRDASTTAVDTAIVLLGAGVTVITHPLLYVKLLIQIGHEPLIPTVGTTMFGRKVLYLPGFFSYAQHIIRVDGKRGLFRGLSPRIMSSAISTMVRSKVKQAIPAEQVENVSNRDDLKTSLRKVVKETSHEMVIQCLSRIATHPFHVISVRCMAQFVGREIKYRCRLSRGWCGLPNTLPGANYPPSRTPTAPDVTGRPNRSRTSTIRATASIIQKARCIKAGIERLKNSFYLKAIRLLNSHH
ncbi:mitochondrial carrier homolog 1-like isoform X2 [Salvelinus alpinus]|uniref:mitochondrial carrier homolog 1-like isoform X2 n=1 Tax=Salvelinus alpinus TaxID=8036 RepID=UPI0039FD98D1